MAQILPGSWELGCVSDGAGNTLDDYAYVFGADGFEIEIRGDGASDAARLITAAPEILEALKFAEQELEVLWRPEGKHALVLSEVRAAIAKAEGRS